LPLAFGAGCVHLDQEIHIEKGGSGKILYHYSVESAKLGTIADGQATIEEWQGFAPASERKGLHWFFNEDAVRRYFSGTGMQVERFRPYSGRGRRHVEIRVTVDNAAEALATGKFGAFILEPTPAGTRRFRADLPGEPAKEGDADVGELEKLRALCSGLRLGLRVVVPGKVLRTTAPSKTRTSAEWLFDVEQDPAFLLAPPKIELEYRPAN
jgi:hypothetical protein